MTGKTILITGVTSGIGEALAICAVKRGYTVIGTARTNEARDVFLKRSMAQECLLYDLREYENADRLVQSAQRVSGPVDILVNNAGFGHEGVFEESPIDDLIEQLHVNLVGHAALIKSVLPGMRARRSGRIVNITSMAAEIGFPGLSYYCAGKFGMEGLSESLSRELQHLNIFVTAVALGQFRTDWAGRSLKRSPRIFSEYDALFDPLRQARQSKSGKQPGSPEKAAKAILDMSEAPNPPSRLVLGSDAFTLLLQKAKRSQLQLAASEELSRSTDF